MNKVLLIQRIIPEYRVPIFNELAKKVDLTIVYSEGDLPANTYFKALKIETFSFHLRFHKKNLYLLACKYDVVICIAETSSFYSRLLGILPRRFKLIYWGIGVAAGYNMRYDSCTKIARTCFTQAQRADAVIYYSDYPVNKYFRMGIPLEKMFVANNTVEVLPIEYKNDKDIIIFIGSLYKQKKVDLLLAMYRSAYRVRPSIPKLVIIGDGDQRLSLEQYVSDNNLNDNVFFLGKITDDFILKDYFSHSLLCISPNQAGLSVLKSMGYGVPFVTHKDAITGGEIFNIHNGTDGILLDDFNQLEDVIIDCDVHKEKYVAMGRKAMEYYQKERKPSAMVKGFMQAINYVLSEHGKK